MQIPLIIYNFLQSIRLFVDTMVSFNEHCVIGLEPNLSVIERNLKNSLMLVTVLNPHIGYENAATIAKLAYKEGIMLKEAALKSGIISEAEFDRIVRPESLVYSND